MNDFAPMMAMTRIEATSLAVSICVIVFLTLGFGVLFYLYYHYYRKCVDGGLEDGYLKNEIIKENPSYFKNVEAVIKDDSLDNLVLVEREVNQKVKGNHYPVPSRIQDEQKKLWHFLLKKKAISEKKYSNLTRTSKIKIEEVEDFVSRQINVINYSNVIFS